VNQLEMDLGVPVDQSKLDKNPMVRTYGYGPKDKLCKHCKHLFYREYANRYYKCALRKNTNSPSTDHRVNWNACAKFEKGEWVMTDFNYEKRIGTDEEWAEIVSDLLVKNKQYEIAIKEALELMEYGGPGTKSKVKYVLEQALDWNACAKFEKGEF